MSKISESMHPEKTLVMVSSPLSGGRNMPTNLLGLTSDPNPEGGHMALWAPLTSDIAYYALKGKRIQPLLGPEQVDKARNDESLRTFPQLSTLDWVYSGLVNPEDYPLHSSISVPVVSAYIVPVDRSSVFGLAYFAMMAELGNTESGVCKHVRETAFSLDVTHYMSNMLDPEKSKDVLIPPDVPARPEGPAPHIVGARQ